MGITVDEFKNNVSIKNPLARKLSNKLKQQDILTPSRSEDRELLCGMKRPLESFQEQSISVDPLRLIPRLRLVANRWLIFISTLYSHGWTNAVTPVRWQSLILDSHSMRELSQMANKHQIVAYMTPVFENILQQEVPTMQVVNSEEYP